MKISFKMVALFFVFIADVALMVVDAGDAADRSDQAVTDPLNTTYFIKGQAVSLTDGHSESPAAPGSATKTKTAVQGRPVYGDLDRDGDEDAVLFLTHDPGGSGTFYYVAAAINASGGYRGTNAILLGDRIAPKDIGIRDDAIVVNYADRRPGVPMSANPIVGQTAVLLLRDFRLVDISPVGVRGNVVEGLVTIGHEVRSFQPCDAEDDLWLMGQSLALNGIMSAYRQELPDQKDYRPLFMILAGERVKAPPDGFGANYEAGFLATHLVRVVPGANCTRVSLDIDSENGYRHKITFDISKLNEDGLYGPPSGKRALSYEFCIPDAHEIKAEVAGIDPTVRFYPGSPGRIGCDSKQVLCIGSTHQAGVDGVIQDLAQLPYVQRIDESVFE